MAKLKDWDSSHKTVMDDSGIKTEVITYAHEPGHIYTRRTQPNANQILEQNLKMRNAGGPKDMSFGRWVANIPNNDYIALKRKYPEIDSKDRDIRQKALVRLLKSPEFKKYLVNDKV